MGSPSEGDRPRSFAELKALSAAKIRKLLGSAGVSDHGCIEKSDFIARAAQHLGLKEGVEAPANNGTGHATPQQPQLRSSTEARGRSRSGSSMRSEYSFFRTPPPSRSPSRDRKRRSRSRSSSSGSGPDGTRKPKDFGMDTLKLSADDLAALTMGANGKSYEKLARVAEVEITLRERDMLMEIQGSRDARKRGKKYANMVMRCRLGPHMPLEEFDDGDLTIISVPPDVVGYVQGQGGGVFRSIEEEWNTLMFFIDTDLTRSQRVAIFGNIRGRRGSELKILSAIETKMPGYMRQVHDDIINRDKYKDPTRTWGTDFMTFRDEGEISYALGKQGGTRRKLERSSGAVVQYVGMMVICTGTKVERLRAREYMKWLFQQLEGPVYVHGWEDREDCTVLDIPTDCIGYITGNRRAALGAMEEEWGSLMFFMSEQEERHRIRGGGTERLIIFGLERARRGSELKIMSSIETKSPGFFTRGLREKISDRKAFDTDRLLMRDDEVSYALGKDGATRKKLELASGAILQYVGHVAFIAGSMSERRRAREFVQWLLQQRRGSVTIEIKGRDDVTEVNVPANCKGWIAGNRGSELRRMEQTTGTYMFMALDGKGEERLLIFGVNKGKKHSLEGGRLHAERLVKDMIREKQQDDDRRTPAPGARRRSPSRSNSRAKSPPKSRWRGRSSSRSRSRGRR